MRPLTENRLRALTRRCERSKAKRCKCRCHGELHGQAHGEDWLKGEVLRARLALVPAEQIDWIGHAGFEQYL